MTTIEQNSAFHIAYNGSNTWHVIDSNGDSWGYFDTERKARNAFKRFSKSCGVS